MKTAKMGFDLQASLDMVDRPTDTAAIVDTSHAPTANRLEGAGGLIGTFRPVATDANGVVVRIENPDGSVDWYYGFSADQSAGSTSALSPSNVDTTFSRVQRGDRLLSYLDSMQDEEGGM